MKFKGTIIITDPCYIIKDDTDDWGKCSFGSNMKTLGFTNYISKSTLYGDWSCTTYCTPCEDVKTQLENLIKLNNTRWDLAEKYGEDSIQAKVYDDKIADASIGVKKICEFCADAGLVGVFLLDEVLKYNPKFDWWISRPWTTTLIKDFDGEVHYYIDSNDDAHIIGVGSVNFYTTQTGL